MDTIVTVKIPRGSPREGFNEQKPFDMVVHNGTIVTINKDFDVIDEGLICIEGTRLRRVEKARRGEPLPAACETIDARGGIILPGLVNTHTHSAMTLFRGLADDLPLMRWLNDYIFEAEKRWVDPQSVYAASLLACAEMLLGGTTTVCDGYFFEDAVASAMQSAAIRAVLGQGIVDFPAPGVPEPRENVEEARRFIARWSGKSPLVTPGLFCHSPYTCSERTLRKAREVADESNTLFQIHVAETRDEVARIRREHGLSPVAYLDRIGILKPNTLLVHAIWVDERDIEIMAKRSVGVAVTTESEMKLASGVAPVPDFLERGIALGLGTDGCASNNDMDMFQEMDFTAKLHKVRRLDPTTLSAREILRLATRGGAEALGLDREIGALEAGKKADILIVDTRKAHLTPLYDPSSHLVYAARGHDVRDVIIDGRMVVRERSILTFDVHEAMSRVNAVARQIAKEMDKQKKAPGAA